MSRSVNAGTKTPKRRWSPVMKCSLLATAVFFLWGYVTGQPTWGLLLIVSGVPLAVFLRWIYTGRLRRYRFLFGLYGSLAVFGVYEAWEYGRIPAAVARFAELPKPPGEPNLYFEYDLPSVESQLFPGDPESLLLEAVQLNYCTTEGLPFHLHPFCQKYGEADRKRIRKVLEEALAKEPKTNEDLYYSYIDVLKGTGADASEVRAAISQWRMLFPLSTRPVPQNPGH